jgi:DNA polymerase I
MSVPKLSPEHAARLPEPGAGDACYLLDLSSWARALYEFHRSRGVDVDHPDSVLVAAGVLKRLIDDVLVAREPAFLAVAMDGLGELGWRHALWADYKAARRAAPPGPGYVRQLDVLLEVFLQHRIPVLQGHGQEADDYLGALTHRARAAGLRVVLLSLDHDLWQLFETAEPRAVVAWDVSGGRVFTVADVQQIHGVPPELLTQAMALAGNGDEAPGIAGIGPAKAARLLARHKTLETVLKHWQWETGKLGPTIRDGAAAARMSLELVTLDRHAPVACTLDELAVGWSEADAAAICRLGVKHGLGILRDARALPKIAVDPAQAARWRSATKAS